jgi:hypothetical protein
VPSQEDVTNSIVVRLWPILANLGAVDLKVRLADNRGSTSSVNELARAAEQAREWARRARERAAEAFARAADVERRFRPGGSPPEDAAGDAKLREERAKDSARFAHKQAADMQERSAVEFAERSGDDAGADRAHTRADDARERENH